MPAAKDREPGARVLLVIGHGRRASLCHHLLGIARDALAGMDVPHRIHDLLADGFDPLLRLAPDEPHATPCSADSDPLVHRYQQDVRWASAYLVVHPVWWFAPPAILKGWIDRVLVHDVAIEQREGDSPAPLLTGRRALVVQTFNAPRSVDRILFRGISGRLWKQVVFPSIGIRKVAQLSIHSAETLNAEQLERHRHRLRRAVAALAGRRGA